MGDRGNIKITYKSGKSIYFYTHWRGNSLPMIVKDALSKRERWNDEAYLSRIIFCELVKHDMSGTTSFGIAPYIPDNEYKVVEIDCAKQKVNFLLIDSTKIDDGFYFDEYINKDDAELVKLFTDEIEYSY